jgi:hypothetical protein
MTMQAGICAEPGEVLLAIRRVGLCGTDYHIMRGTQPYLSYPRVIGRELSAEAIETDDDGSFAPGTLVAVLPYLFCGACRVRLHRQPGGHGGCNVRVSVVSATITFEDPEFQAGNHPAGQPQRHPLGLRGGDRRHPGRHRADRRAAHAQRSHARAARAHGRVGGSVIRRDQGDRDAVTLRFRRLNGRT